MEQSNAQNSTRDRHGQGMSVIRNPNRLKTQWLRMIVVPLLLCLLSTPSASAQTWAEIVKQVASDREVADDYGHAVAIDGDYAIVGALYEDTEGNGAGAAYILRRDEGGTDNWGQIKKITGSGIDDSDKFGVSVSISGDHIAVGAQSANGKGAVFLFHKDEGGIENWGEVKEISASDASTGVAFGHSISLSGENAIGKCLCG